ncbi:MAG: lipopolysaccharide heptosyltransferase II [Deltaproteobacteria bacterium]|nr:lipopolysaccharide heptosyltransferase II [Deltaproteobacteria bacterium]
MPPKAPRHPISIGNHHSPLPLAVQQAFNQLTVQHRRKFFPHQIKNILVRAVNWVGDAIMTLPAIGDLKKLYPWARLSVLAHERVAPVFQQQPAVDEIIPYLPKPPATPMKTWLVSLAALRQKKFDLAVIFPNSFEAALVTWLAGAPHRVGYGTDGRAFLFTQVVWGVDNMAGLHQVYRHKGVLRPFGRISADGFPELILTRAEQEAGKELLVANGWRPSQKIVGLSPGAAYGPAKQWPPERFAAVADLLHRECDALIVFLGAASDQETTRRIAGAMQSPSLNLAGRTDLRTAFAMIYHLDILITNDSGLMHAAAALWTPPVALFGSTDPCATGPFTPLASVVRHPVPCSPCLKRQCPEDNMCWELITVTEVAEQARYWLRRQ